MGSSRLEKKMMRKSAAYKTVDVFGGITGRRLWLEDSGPDGGACTDGHAILAPFDDPGFYRYVEHEIAHVLFRSDAIAREKFLEEYVAKVAAATKAAGVILDAPRFREMMGHVVAILEDHRVNTLWGMLYEGSFAEIRAMHRAEAEEAMERAGRSLMSYFHVCYGGLDAPSSPFARYRPFLLEALRKVERRGFSATLLATKWLVTQLVSELIREKRHEPSPPPPQQPQQQQQPAQGTADASGDPQDQPAQGSPGAADGQDGGNAAPGWYPPPVAADLKVRSEALQALAAMAGTDPAGQAMDDVRPPKFPGRQDIEAAAALVAEVTSLDANNAAKMDDFMASSGAAMQAIVSAAKDAVRQSMHEDEWLRRDAKAKVVFRDAPKGDRAEFPLEDRQAVQRLRAQFVRVMGRTKAALGDSGTEIDVPAWLAGQASGQPEPCFRHEARGRGFQGLVLVDRSRSMKGCKERQASRACRIIAEATRFPFVDLRVWGFRSGDKGEVTLDRHDRKASDFSGSCSGTTPLHVAVRVALRALEGGREAKHLFVVTDGLPVYIRSDGEKFPTWQMMDFVRKEVQQARRHGITVSCLLIGSERGTFDVSEKHMRFMFGRRQDWSMIAADQLGRGMIRLVSSSFAAFLGRS